MLTNRTRTLTAALIGPLAAALLVSVGVATAATAAPAAATPAAPVPPADGGAWTAYPLHQAWTDTATPRVAHLDEGGDLPFGLVPKAMAPDGRARDRVAYVEFDATRYPGAALAQVVLGAGLSSTGDCPAAPVELWTSDPIGAAPTAARPPTLRDHLATLTWQVPAGNSSCQVHLDVTATFDAARAAGDPSVTFAFVRPADLALARRSAGTLTRYSNVQGAYQYPVAAPTALHPSGTGPNERYQRSPVTFRAAPGNPGNQRGDIGFQIQRAGEGGAWLPVASPTTSGSTTQTLPDGDVRWRARTVLATTVGPWSRWITITVDSRTPAAPVVTIAGGEIVVGRPVDVTVSSPDGVAALYHLSEFSDAASYGVDQDPCTLGHGFVCPSTLGGSVTVPYTFLSRDLDQLYVRAYGRGGTVSASSPELEVRPTPDYDAVGNALRWPLPNADGPGTAVAEANGGPSLRIGPVVRVASQHLAQRRAPVQTVPSIDTATSRSVRTTGTVLDTATTFTVAAVVSRPTDTTHVVTVFDQPGPGGSAFSLVLDPSSGYWTGCVAITDGRQSCTIAQAFLYGDTDAVALSYDAVSRQFSVSTANSAAQPESLPGVAPLRTALGGLRFAFAAVPGTVAYAGPLGAPLVAHGWITGADVAASLVVT